MIFRPICSHWPPLWLTGPLHERVALCAGRHGDSSYEHFCGAGRHLDALLQELGASPLLPRLEIDATVDDEPEKVALAWLNGWQNKL